MREGMQRPDRRRVLASAVGGMALFARAGAAPPPPTLFDCYAHVVSPDRAAYPPHPLGGETLGAAVYVDPIDVDRLIAAMDAAGVGRAALIHRAFVYGYDNRLVAEAAARHPTRLSFVPVVDPADPATIGRIEAWRRAGGLAAVRVVGERHDAAVDWIDAPGTLAIYDAALALGLPVEMELYPTNNVAGLTRVVRLLGRRPRLRLVIDNLAVPKAEGAPDFGLAGPWRDAREAHNLSFKIATGNFTRLKAAGADPAGFMRRAIDLYGVRRLMWGSDHGQTAGDYVDKCALALAVTASLTPHERRMFLHDNGSRLFWPKEK